MHAFLWNSGNSRSPHILANQSINILQHCFLNIYSLSIIWGFALEDINAIHPPHHFPQLLAAQTYTFKWWMGHYNASSPKPQRGWCNNKAFANLDKGPYRRSVQPKAKVQTVRKTISKNGKVSYVGTAALKGVTDLSSFARSILCLYTVATLNSVAIIACFRPKNPFKYFSHHKCPRTYPQAFADRIRELFPRLITGGEGVPEVDDRESPEATFESLAFSTWPEAKLMPVVKYIRGNEGLKVPSNWKMRISSGIWNSAPARTPKGGTEI